MRAIVLCLVLVLSSTYANATVLNFEGVNTANEGSHLPNSYGGFSWGVTEQGATGPALIFKDGVLMNMPHAAASPDWFLLANDIGIDGRTVYAKSATVFDFVSAYLTRPLDQADSLLVTGLLDGVILDATMITPGTTPQQFFFNFTGIDEINFKPIAGGLLRGPNIGIDDFTYEGSPSPYSPHQSVPEPSSLASLLFGLGVIAKLRRRRHNG